MPRCRNLQSGRPLMLMMRSPLLSDIPNSNVAEQFPIDAWVSEPAKQSAADAYDALSIAFCCRDFQCCRAKCSAADAYDALSTAFSML